jgi:hypothetical protein
MNKTVRNIGLAALAAGVLYYPAMRLYRAVAARRKQEDTDEQTNHVMKNFVPAYRGQAKHNHTHRKTRK